MGTARQALLTGAPPAGFAPSQSLALHEAYTLGFRAAMFSAAALAAGASVIAFCLPRDKNTMI
jgi:hypothetical protein